ncbi:DUF3040 domain-containing protein [Arthrobacter gyeryongensis]|uniref:DUF3040 domain-containing protein n=1 Tax=Arthrobacter gyeryongensis TaxID=1650592 RepID=UPI0031EEC2F0
MPLSDYERRRLQELERDLADNDPVLARELETGRSPRPWLRWSAGSVLVLVGFGLMILGNSAQLPGLGVLGFLLMFGSVCWHVWRRISVP